MALERSSEAPGARISSWDLGAGALVAADLARDPRPALTLIGGGLISDRWRVGLSAWAGLPETVDVVIRVVRGSITSQQLGAAARAGPCLGDRLRLCGELALGARFAWADARGALLFQDQGTRWLVRPAAGLWLTLAARPLRWVALSAAVGASVTLWASYFQVQGDDSIRAGLPRVELFGALTAAWVTNR